MGISKDIIPNKAEEKVLNYLGGVKEKYNTEPPIYEINNGDKLVIYLRASVKLDEFALNKGKHRDKRDAEFFYNIDVSRIFEQKNINFIIFCIEKYGQLIEDSFLKIPVEQIRKLFGKNTQTISQAQVKVKFTNKSYFIGRKNSKTLTNVSRYYNKIIDTAESNDDVDTTHSTEEINRSIESIKREIKNSNDVPYYHVKTEIEDLSATTSYKSFVINVGELSTCMERSISFRVPIKMAVIDGVLNISENIYILEDKNIDENIPIRNVNGIFNDFEVSFPAQQMLSELKNIDTNDVRISFFDTEKTINITPVKNESTDNESKTEYTPIEKMGQLLITADTDTQIYILDSHSDISLQLKNLCNDLDIQSVRVACGYAFSSGFSMLTEILENPLLKPKVPVRILIGSLQKYNDCLRDSDKQLTGMDKKTASLLNSYIDNENVSLFTCENRFYHGKFYMIVGKERTVICLGSSNISRSAFALNYELNIAFNISNGSPTHIEFSKWANELFNHSRRLTHLDESLFSDNEMNVEEAVTITKISLESIRNRIEQLTDEEVKYRLNLWIEKEPDNDGFNPFIPSLPDYFAFVYSKYSLLVLESFNAGNAYYCIKFSGSIENEINRLSSLSKTEIFSYSKMPKRGYHTKNRRTLEKNIDSFFS